MSTNESAVRAARPPYVTASLLILIGLALFGGGGYLVALGGSPYYVIAGAAVLVAGVLYWRGNRWGERIYALMLLGSLIWAVCEAWGNPWALVARLFAPAVLGLLISMPWVRRGLNVSNPTMWQSGALHGALVILIVIGVQFFQAGAKPDQPPAVAAATEPSPADSNWPNFGNTLQGTHASPLTQITPDNVAKLQVAWIHRSGDFTPTTLNEATPLKVGDLLYTCTPRFIVLAIDAKTGQERWRFDPKIDTSKYRIMTCRGVSYYKQPDRTGACAERIIASSPDGKLRALDALDGKPCEDFGDGGAVSLLDGLGKVDVTLYINTSPATIAGGVAVVGALVYDNLSTDMPSGVVRAYDVTTGALRWAWDMGAPDRIGAPAPGETYTRSTPNAWTPFAADEALGLVYVPTGNPSPDFFGGLRRPFDEKYGSSLVALSLADGRPKWSFQTTHHDLWDYDIPAQPVLVDLPTAEGVTPVVIQSTKRGELFVLDRRDGKPVVPVHEVDAPQDAIAGDWVSKTQPYSDLSFAPPVLKESDMWGLTPIDMMVCRITFRQTRYEGNFTPSGLTPSLQYPGSLGTIDWGGVTVDTDKDLLVANTSDFPWIVKHMPRDQDPDKPPFWPQEGTPYTLHVNKPFYGPMQVPCTQPPWGQLAVVDLKTNKILWRHPVGTARDTGPFGLKVGLPVPMGVPSIGGTIVTRGGLIFMGATLDRYFRAFDVRTGNELWRARLPAGGQAMPMTYMTGGKQYVVITAGGHGLTGTKTGDYTIAYTLPDAK